MEMVRYTTIVSCHIQGSGDLIQDRFGVILSLMSVQVPAKCVRTEPKRSQHHMSQAAVLIVPRRGHTAYGGGHLTACGCRRGHHMLLPRGTEPSVPMGGRDMRPALWGGPWRLDGDILSAAQNDGPSLSRTERPYGLRCLPCLIHDRDFAKIFWDTGGGHPYNCLGKMTRYHHAGWQQPGYRNGVCICASRLHAL